MRPELYLKRLPVGGMRVSRSNRNFRTKALSTSTTRVHDAWRLYRNYADTRGMMG